jgi:hypothetical protein
MFGVQAGEKSAQYAILLDALVGSARRESRQRFVGEPRGLKPARSMSWGGCMFGVQAGEKSAQYATLLDGRGRHSASSDRACERKILGRITASTQP